MNENPLDFNENPLDLNENPLSFNEISITFNWKIYDIYNIITKKEINNKI